MLAPRAPPPSAAQLRILLERYGDIVPAPAPVATPVIAEPPIIAPPALRLLLRPPLRGACRGGGAASRGAARRGAVARRTCFTPPPRASAASPRRRSSARSPASALKGYTRRRASAKLKPRDPSLMSFFEETLPKWAAVAESDAFASGQQVPCKLFLDATVQLIKIFDSIYGMGMVKDDIDGNRAKIEANLLKLPADAQPAATLQSMCRAELAAAKGDAAAASVEGSTCLAILWLKRALLLVEGMLEALVADAKAELADCVNKGYEKGLKMHHNMIMKGVFNTAYHAIPYRADFTKALGDPAKVEADMPAVWKTFAAIMTPLDAFLKETKIEPPPSDSWW